MSNVIVVWANGGASDFERHMPLVWGAERNRKLGLGNNFKLIFLEGLTGLEPAYRDELSSLGYQLIDGSSSFKHCCRRFSQLAVFSDYERKCFLRWLVLKDLFGSSPIIHYDGDIVFNAPPDELADTLGEFTFVLQGCPAFVSTGRSVWLQEYENNLVRFTDDIQGYSAEAWRERAGWELSSMSKWSGARFRKVISSDQDLISHLIHSDRLPQSNPAEVKKKSELVLFENPLEFFVYYPELPPVNYRRMAGVDFFCGRKVAFWHMQSDFVRYLVVNRLRGPLNKVSRCPNGVEQIGIEQFIWRLYLRLTNKSLNRLEIYRHFFEYSDFSGVFDGRNFWKEHVFSG